MLERSSKASKELAMSPLAKLRVSTLACALFFSVSTAAQPAFAEVLISVNKSSQQMSASADGVPRYRFAVSTGRAGYGRQMVPTIRSVWLPHGSRSSTTIRQCRIRSFSPREVMRSMGAPTHNCWAGQFRTAVSVSIRPMRHSSFSSCEAGTSTLRPSP